MTREPDFDELIGAEASGAERERLRHAHDLLLQAGPPPELPPSLERAPSFDAAGVVQLSRRRVVKRRALLLLAASLTIVAVFFAGYAVRGGSSSAAPKPVAETRPERHDGSPEGSGDALGLACKRRQLADDAQRHRTAEAVTTTVTTRSTSSAAAGRGALWHVPRQRLLEGADSHAERAVLAAEGRLLGRHAADPRRRRARRDGAPARAQGLGSKRPSGSSRSLPTPWLQ